MPKINLYLLVILCVLCSLAPSSPALAVPHGSNLRNAPNTNFGCELAPIFDPITGAPVLVPSNQTSCTMRNVGYINSLQIASYVPSNGFITQIRLRSPGPNPARLRLTILQGSPGLCCTGKFISASFQPRPNGRITVRNFRVPVLRSAQRNPGQGVIQVTDVVGLTAVGPGTLPLFDQGTAGTYTSGSALTQFWYPFTARGVPRNEGFTTVDGLELLLRWNFVPASRRDQILR